jgi:site-specific recombinase XerD
LTLEIVEDPLESFLDIIYLQSHSEKSRRAYRININKFRRFVEESYRLDEIGLVNRIKRNDLDVFDVLRKLVVHLDKSGKRPATIKLGLASVKGYLRHHGIKIYSEDFKQYVKLPKNSRTREEPMNPFLLFKGFSMNF